MDKEPMPAEKKHPRIFRALLDALDESRILYECPSCFMTEKEGRGKLAPRCDCRGRSWKMVPLGLLLTPDLDVDMVLKALKPLAEAEAGPDGGEA